MYIRRFAALAAASLIGGCAIHPAPEDVTGLDTADIVKQIRCETRDAARMIILDELRRMAERRSDPIARDLLAQYTEDQERMVDFDANRLFPGPFYKHTRELFALLYGGATAYTFELTMNETNNFGSTANLFGPWANKLTLGLTGNADRMRQNVRTFTVTDKFDFLLKDLNTLRPGDRRYCDGHVALSPNYIYPIAGKIGMYNTVYTFFTMSIFDNLAGKDASAGVKGAPSMAEDLTFTTQFDLQAMPKVTFAQIGNGFQAADASVTGFFARRDVHRVTVGLALEPSGQVAVAGLQGFVFSGFQGSPARRVTLGRPGGEVLILNRITATATSAGTRLALYAIDQLKSQDLKLTQQ
jgi:hypothetical protein